MSEHAFLAPSAMKRTLACPGSVKPIAMLPRGGSSAAADRGTLLHHAVVYAYKHRLPADRMVGHSAPGVHGQVVTREDARYALAPAMAMLVKLLGPAKAHFEMKVKLSPLCWGTADVLARFFNVGIVCDFKFGAHKVEVENNEQLLTYAAGALKMKWHRAKLLDGVMLAIIQPEHRPVLQMQSVKLPQVRAHAERVRNVQTMIEADAAPLRKGPHCDSTYCPLRPTCPEYNKGVELLDPARFR